MIENSSLEVMRDIHHRIPEIEIRDEQIEALDAIEANERAGNPASLIVMPPGMGKTLIMAADIRRRHLRNPNARVLFLCDNNETLNQSRATFDAVSPEFSTGLFSGDGRDYDELAVLFGSFQVMRDWRHAFFKNEFKYGVVDESQHSKAPTYEPTLKYFQFAHLLGATATPDRFDVKDIRDIFGPEVYRLPIEVAIARRRLADVDYYVIADEVVETQRVVDDEGWEYNLGDFNRVVFAPRRDEEIVSIAQRYAESLKNPKTIGFCKSIEHAEALASLFDGAAALHSGISRKEQRRLIDELRRGERKAIFTVDMANEGLNVPDVNQILLLRGTGSKAVYYQQLGRGLRRTPTKKRVQVLDFVNNAERLLMVDRVWREAAKLNDTGPEDKEEVEMLNINMSNVQFNESSRRALSVLRAISGKVYSPDQIVTDGSVLAGQLAHDLQITKPALLALAASLRIQPSTFPTRRGTEIPYFQAGDVERIRMAYAQMFSRR